MREPEPDVVERARQGDLGAFESLVRAYQADVWRFAYHLTRDRTVADDVTQEAFLRAFRAIHTYRGEAKFTSWLLRIGRNCAIDAHRVRRRQHELALRLQVASGRDPAVSSDPTGPEARSRIRESIAALPQALREPFVVIEVLGFTYREASVILDTNVGTLKSRMFRARAHLMQSLHTQGAADEM